MTTHLNRYSVLTCIALGAMTLGARGQNVPIANTAPVSIGFQLPTLAGQISYALSASQTVITGYSGNGGTVSSTNVSGDFAYITDSKTHPFAALYSGGYLASESSQLPSSVFQNLALSQTYRTRTWNFVANDTVSYLPESPVGGISGIPGIGDLGITPVTTGDIFGAGILTNYDQRVSNVVGGTASKDLTGSTSLNATGTYAIERFLGDEPGDSAYNSNQVQVTGGILHRINARNTFGVNYDYSYFTYTGEPFSFTSNGVNFEYIRRITRQWTLDASLGPQWNTGTTFSSTSLDLAAAITLSYLGKRSSSSLSYVRGTSAGSGVVEGALTNSVVFSTTRQLNAVWSAAASASYTRSQSLPNNFYPPFTIDSEIASAQISRSLGRSFSAYASYTLENQSLDGSAATALTFSGLQQVFGVGITYSPGSKRLGRH
jgi:hypothetical protein